MASLISILLALAFNFSVYLSSQNDEIRYMLLRRVNSLAMELHNDNLDDNIKELHMSVSTQNAIDSPDWVKIFVLDEKRRTRCFAEPKTPIAKCTPCGH